MIIGNFYLAAAGDFLEQAYETSSDISRGFNELWNEVLGGDLYGSLCDVGVLLAIATLVLFFVQWTKGMLRDEYMMPYSELIWPLAVGLFLFNNGALLQDTTLALRNIINDVNNQVLATTAADYNIREAYEEANQWGLAETLMGGLIQDCTSGKKTMEQKRTCLESVEEDVLEVRDELRSYRGNDGSWWNLAAERIQQARNLVENGGGNVLESLFGGISGGFGALVQTAIRSLLIGLNMAYQWGIELAFICTALVAPLAVGASLLPSGAKPIISWISGFLGLGMAKLSLNIILGLAGLLIITAEANEPMFFLLFVGIIAPILASSIAVGAGMASFAALSRTAAVAMGMGMNAVSAAVPVVGSTVARAVQYSAAKKPPPNKQEQGG